MKAKNRSGGRDMNDMKLYIAVPTGDKRGQAACCGIK